MKCALKLPLPLAITTALNSLRALHLHGNVWVPLALPRCGKQNLHHDAAIRSGLICRR